MGAGIRTRTLAGLIGSVWLCLCTSIALADMVTWDSGCGDSEWYSTCDFWVADAHYTDNNWDVAWGVWPDWPDMPGTSDDAFVGNSYVVLSGSASVNSFATGGLFELQGSLSVVTSATYEGPMEWKGGGFGGGTHFVNGGLFITGDLDKSCRNGAICNSEGTTCSTNTGIIYIYDEAVFNNVADAIFTDENDAMFHRPVQTTGGYFNNYGTFNKTTTAGDTWFRLVEFNNSGTVNVATGRLLLNYGGASTGGFTISSGAVVEFSGNTYSLDNNTTFSGDGLTRLSGGSLHTVAESVVPVEHFEMTGGGIWDEGELVISESFHWSGGSMHSAGLTTVQSTAAMSIDGVDSKSMGERTLDSFAPGTWSSEGSVTFYNDAVFNNADNITWDGTGTIYIYDEAAFNNLIAASFTDENDAMFYRPTETSIGYFNNYGTFNKTTTAGDTWFRLVEFNNSGAVNVGNGRLLLNYGGTSTGVFAISPGAVVEFIGRTYYLDDDTTFSGGGLTRLSGGSLYTVAGSVIPVEHFEITGGGLRDIGELTISDSFHWNGGSMYNTGVTTVQDTAVMSIDGTSNKAMSERTLDSFAPGTWSSEGSVTFYNDAVFNNADNITWDGTGTIYIYDEATFNNVAGAIFTDENDAMFHRPTGSSVGYFNNYGTFNKTTTTGDTWFRLVEFNNSGAVNVENGRLLLNYGGTSTGIFAISPGAVVEFAGRTYYLDDETTFSGGGLTRLSGGSLYTAAGCVIPVEHFEITGGGLRDIGELTIIDSFHWNGGSMYNAGVTTVQDTAVMSIDGTSNKGMSERTLNNFAPGTWSSTGSVSFYNGAVFNNADNITWNGTGKIYISSDAQYNNLPGATFDAQSDTVFDSSSGSGTFSNAGTFIKSGGLGVTEFDSYVYFNNSGKVEVRSGTLLIDYGGTSTGVFDISAGATVDFDANYSLDAGTTIVGEGPARITASTTTIASGVTVPAENIDLTGGTLRGLGSLTVSDTFNWTGGSMYDAGQTTVIGGGTMNISGTGTKTLSERTLSNAGDAVYTDTGSLRINSAAILNNLVGATFDVGNDVVIDHTTGTSGTINNAGYFVKSAGAGTTRVDTGIAFTNSGTVELRSGVLDADGGYTQSSGLTWLNGGNLSSNVTIEIQGGILAGTGVVDADVNNAGEVRPGLSPGVLNVDGDYTQLTTGILTIELSGSQPGVEQDQLDVVGTANLAGELRISHIDDYGWERDQQYVIVTAQSVVGTFSSVSGPGEFEVIYNADNVTISPVCRPADFDCNGDVSIEDFTVWADCLYGPDAELPTACTDADLDEDEDVDLGDFAELQRIFTGAGD